MARGRRGGGRAGKGAARRRSEAVVVEADGGEGQVRGSCRKLVEHNLEVKK